MSNMPSVINMTKITPTLIFVSKKINKNYLSETDNMESVLTEYYLKYADHT